MVPAEDRRARLAAFLRAHRARLTPEQAGLAGGGRRRTPGLRREEVAQLAGISSVWYVRIEQGREVAASPAALDRIAKALHLTPAERAHLFALADRRDPRAGVDNDGQDRLEILRSSVLAFNGPAYVLDWRWNACAWNAPAKAHFVKWLGQGKDRPNLLRYVFLDPEARTFIVDWEDRARRLVAECRGDLVRQREDEEVLALIAELRSGSTAFASWWDEQIVLDPEGGERRFMHPDKGPLTYEQISFLPVAAPGFRLVQLLPKIPDQSR